MIIFFFGCSDKKIESLDLISNAKVHKISWENIDGFYKDNLDDAFRVFKKDCISSKKYKLLTKVCKKANNTSSSQEFFTQNFTPYRLLNKNNDDNGLITGYYEPILKGSYDKNEIYQYPIYKTPNDLISVHLDSIYPELKYKTIRGKLVNNKLIPYETRKEITKQNQLEPLLYLDSKIDKFFLEIQGSGKVLLDTGELINVAYANQNGRKYYPIGKKLIEDGTIKKENMSLQSIKQWCLNNPDKVDELFYLNESVVFFQISNKAATGSLGVELVAHRNIAVDRKFIPLGFLVFLNTTDPLTNEPINKLVVAADTGGAIKGEIRADLFWGSGEGALEKAGKMAQSGKLTLLVPNEYNNKTYSKEQLIKAKEF
jgi:membrane-bound lytic murein transglycosylase A